MAGSSEDWRRQHRRGHADPHDDVLEEGEFVPGGYESDMDTEDYYNRDSPLSLSDTEETISGGINAGCSSVVPAKHGHDPASPISVGSAAASSAAAGNSNANPKAFLPVAAPAVHACPICGKQFRSDKAVCGHMKVHQEPGKRKDKAVIKRGVSAVVVTWGGAGKRGWSGSCSRASSSNSQPDQPAMDIVVAAEPKIVLKPMPLAFAMPNPSSVHMASATATAKPPSMPVASATPNLPSSVPMSSTTANVPGESSGAKPTHKHEDAMEAVMEGVANPSTEAVVHLHAAPAPPPPPSPPAPAAVEQAPAILQQPAAPPRAGRQNPNGYSCTRCPEWYPTHQGLGGHMASHISKDRATGALQDGAAPGRSNAKPEKVHACDVCDRKFSRGVELGGHKRKHYKGPKIVPNKKPRAVADTAPAPAPADNADEAASRGPAVEAAPKPAPTPADNADEAASRGPAVEAAAQPAPTTPAVQAALEPAPASASAMRVPGRVYLFGVDIGPSVQTPAAQDGSSSTQQGSASSALESSRTEVSVC